MTFSAKVLKFYKELDLVEPLPPGVTVMNPYQNASCMEVCGKFYRKFYNDRNKRVLILGINPGRYGAGITGIPFTDPIKLETLFGISNDLPKKPELSAEFIHAMIAAYGGYERFFRRFFINSVSPLGFVAAGKNLNYYDTPLLKSSLEPFIRRSIGNLLKLGIYRDVVYCLGEGENYKFIQRINAEEKWFGKIIPLAHPRFIMQYRRKFLSEYIGALLSLLVGVTAVLVAGQHWAHHQGQRTGWATVIAAGTALSALALGGALLRLPGAVAAPAATARLLLDGLSMATALWFVGWVLFAEPTRLLGAATPVACVPILLATVSAALTTGLVLIIVLRAAPPRRRLALLGAGVTAVTCGGLGLAAGLCQGGLAMALAGAAVLAVGLLAAAVAVHRVDRPGQVDVDLIRRDGEYAFVPMFAMAASAMYHLLQGGRFDVFGIVAGSVEGFALVARQYLALNDVRGYASRLAEREAHFRELAHTDPLTGLANRRGLLRALHRCAEADVPCVLLGLDLDGFKNVNDMRGHDVGDAVLAEVGRRLRGNLRPGDLAARLGGDEFAVLMHGGTDADRVAERLLGVLGRPYEGPDGPVFLSVSIGLAGHCGEPDVELLLRHADLALRYAKQRGKNRIERYDAAYDQLLRRRTMLEHELRGAIERNELRLAFQPVASLPSVRPVGAEALLRWHHPELGNVRPDEFIPLAEECGMIAKLGAWVLHQACYQLSRWLADGHDVWVSVNVSPRELHAPEYVVQVADALRAHHVPPQRLVLEVTEHAVATDLDELIRRLAALRLTGVRIALDDFGAGYSSLGQLRRLPIDILKIDHSLVAEHEPVRPVGRDGPAFAPMVDIVMRLGHQLGMEVIAEGVTTPTELAAVVAAGCRFGQGALFGWGVPAEHLEAMLEAATSPGARPAPLPPVSPPAPARPVAPAAFPRFGPRAAAAASPVPAPRTSEEGSSQVRPAAGSVNGHDTPTSVNQNVGSVDSSREMRQA